MVPPSTVGLEVLALGTGFPMRSPRCLTTMLEVIAEALIMLIITTITVTDDTILLTVTINMELAILRMWRTPLSKEQPRVDQFLPNQKNLQTQGLRTLHQRKISDMGATLLNAGLVCRYVRSPQNVLLRWKLEAKRKRLLLLPSLKLLFPFLFSTKKTKKNYEWCANVCFQIVL